MGREVIGSQGEKLGIVHDLQFDEKGWNVLAIRVLLEKDVAEKYNLDAETVSSLEAAREFARKTQGWLTDAEGEALFVLASRCRPPGVIVEVGSFMGKSTTWLALGSRSGSGLKVYAVDPQRDPGAFDGFEQNMKRAGIEDAVVPYVMTSVKAAPRINDDVVLAFIDGSHEYEDVKQDLRLWFPKVVEGGHMAFHDALSNGETGVHEAVREDVYKSARFRKVRFVGSMVICQKGSSNGFRERLRTIWGLLLYDAIDVVFDDSRKRLRRCLPKPVFSGVKQLLRWLQLETANPWG